MATMSEDDSIMGYLNSEVNELFDKAKPLQMQLNEMNIKPGCSDCLG